jgi:hypothetical protein
MDLVPSETREPVDVIQKYSDLSMFLTDVARSSQKMIKDPPTKNRKQKLLIAMDETFDLIGGVPRLAIWADQNPDEYYKLYAKTLPQQIQASIDGKLTHIIRPALPPTALDGDYTDVTEPTTL